MLSEEFRNLKILDFHFLYFFVSGFSASVLDQWKKYYPHSEESVKTIAHKLSKFDRGPDPDLDANGVKITPKGRVMWSQIMLNNLQEAKKIATDKVSNIDCAFLEECKYISLIS